MNQPQDWLDALLAEVADGRLLPADALQQFFLHKRQSGDPTLTEEDNAFITAMDAAEVAQRVASWCQRNAAAQGGVAQITVDLRRPGFFSPNRRPPSVTGVTAAGRRIMLFSPADVSAGGDYAEDCLRAGGSFTAAREDPVYLPVFRSALMTALHRLQLPEPTFIL